MANHSSLRFFAPRGRRAVALAAAVVLTGAAATYTTTRLSASDSPAPSPAAPPAPRVTVAPVEEKLVTEYEELTGRVDATETVELRARVSGHLEAVRFQAGQLVRPGDVLFTIDSRWYRAQFELAQAHVAQARARATIADSEARRATELAGAAAISNEELEARRARALETRAALAAAEATLVAAKLDLDHTEVRAPIAGRVSRAIVTPGNLISGAAGSATLLTTIVSTGDAFVYADVDETTALRFQRLMRENRLATLAGRVRAELQLGDERDYPRQGYIESADNRLNAATGSLMLRLVFPNEDGALLPGLFARVRIPISAPRPALLISERAIGTDQSQKFVLALEQNNTVAYRTVKLGGAIDGKRIVRDGLRPGDQIVVNGLQRVRPGMTVAPERLAATETAATTQLASR